MDDVLNPTLVQINGRIYCDYFSHGKVNETHESNQEFDPDNGFGGDWLMEDDDDYYDDTCENSCDFEVFQPNNGGWQVNLEIPQCLHAYMIGARHSLRKQMEQETGAKIDYPQRNKYARPKPVVVTCKDRKSVISCANRIHIMSMDVRWRAPFTHFLSIKLSVDPVLTNFEKFRDDILSQRELSHNIDECLFQTPSKLHLTICVLNLLDVCEVERGIDLLQQFPYRDITGGDKLFVDIKGLEVMNDDPSDVDVLYAKVECKNDTLQKLADEIMDTFVRRNFCQKPLIHDRGVKLHATLINSKFRPGIQGVSTLKLDTGKRVMGDYSATRQSFDASKLLKSTKYNNFNFGRICVDEILLSSRSSFTDGYYTTVSNLALK